MAGLVRGDSDWNAAGQVKLIWLASFEVILVWVCINEMGYVIGT